MDPEDRDPRASPDAPEVTSWSCAATKAERLWAGGGIVAIPTESSYGLAVDPRNEVAVAAVMHCKGRSLTQPLPVVAGSIEDLRGLGARLDLPQLAPVLAAWPAALTAVVPLDRPVPAALDGATLAVRIPDHAALRRLLRRTGRTVTATSANRSGAAPATTAGEVRRLLAGRRSLVISDEHALPGGPPSTVVGIRDGRLVVLRRGRYPVDRLLGF